MSNATAARVTPNRRRAVDRLPVTEAKQVRADQAREFETRRKGVISRTVTKVASFFKAIGSSIKQTAVKMATAIKKTPLHVVRAPLWFVVDGVQHAIIFVRKHWGELFAGVVFGIAMFIAPITTLMAAVFVAASYALAKSDSAFARFVSHVFFRAGVEMFANGLVVAVDNRRRR